MPVAGRNPFPDVAIPLSPGMKYRHADLPG
jgi:hypothetical protein